jgi:hypothetical protein
MSPSDEAERALQRVAVLRPGKLVGFHLIRQRV